jgi:hypothetical protein
MLYSRKATINREKQCDVLREVSVRFTCQRFLEIVSPRHVLTKMLYRDVEYDLSVRLNCNSFIRIDFVVLKKDTVAAS